MASVFQKFGGIRPLAFKVGVPPSTVMSWQRHRRIPGWRHQSILDSARRHGIELTPEELTQIPPEDPALSDAAA